MTWKKHFTPVSANNFGTSVMSSGTKAGPAMTNYSSFLPDVYTGAPNRTERYLQYDTMDMDSEVNAALDILTEFCTQRDNENGTPFSIYFKGNPTSTEVKILKEGLQKWCKLQKFETRIFRIFRNVLKYGDCFFLRDPETKKWLFVDASKVVRIIVNESEGKVPVQYVIRDIDFNFKDMVATQQQTTTNASPSGTSSIVSGGALARGMVGTVPTSQGSRFQTNDGEITVDAKHVIHLGLSEGLTQNYPFGNSVLESVFKVYKQKELLEDAIIIYRIQRAPERKVFYVDVGSMNPIMANSFVERVKNEIQQRRIPSSSGGSGSLMDASYNPVSINEDYFFPSTAEGRGSKVEVLPGAQNLGEITDLRFFTNKMFRSLRIPSAYLPTMNDEAANGISDGKVGNAYIQELRFNEYCKRLQSMIVEEFDLEFKVWLDSIGVVIDSSLFEIKFNPPQNFAAYRQAELDSQRMSIFSQIQELKYLSPRFALKRFLGLTEEEIKENERLWREENQDNLTPITPEKQSLRGVGISSSTVNAGIEAQTGESDMDFSMDASPDTGGEMPGSGAGNEPAPPAGP